MIKIYSSLTRKKEKFVPIVDGEVKMYACGITPYDQIHIGHARQAVVYDMIRAYLEYAGYHVVYVRNSHSNLINNRKYKVEKINLKKY